MKPADIAGSPCQCHDCIVAGVNDRDIRRDPQTGRWIHGLQLRRWYEAKDRVRRQFAAVMKTKAMK